MIQTLSNVLKAGDQQKIKVSLVSEVDRNDIRDCTVEA